MSNPELVIQDFGGRLSADMTGARARLVKGASWKRQRIIVILPADAMIPAKVALSHWNMVFPPNQAVVRILAQGMEVGNAYSACVEQILAHPDLSQFEFILTLEHDNLPPSDGVLKLIETLEVHPELSAVSGLYWTKGEGGCCQIWGDPSDPVLNFRPQIPRPETVQECCGCGMGFCLFRLSMFKNPNLRRPWFVTQAGASGAATQDLYAWGDFRKHGYRCAVDTRCKVGHMDAASGTIW